MTQNNDGGPAFPVQEDDRLLRDWLAGQALAGHLASCNPGSIQPLFMAALAEQSYQIADAMLAARDKDKKEAQ